MAPELRKTAVTAFPSVEEAAAGSPGRGELEGVDRCVEGGLGAAQSLAGEEYCEVAVAASFGENGGGVSVRRG